MFGVATFVGGIIRWIFKGFKTRIKDEIDGNFEPTFASSYDSENFVIGIGAIIILIGIFIFIKFVVPDYFN